MVDSSDAELGGLRYSSLSTGQATETETVVDQCSTRWNRKRVATVAAVTASLLLAGAAALSWRGASGPHARSAAGLQHNAALREYENNAGAVANYIGGATSPSAQAAAVNYPTLGEAPTQDSTVSLEPATADAYSASSSGYAASSPSSMEASGASYSGGPLPGQDPSSGYMASPDGSIYPTADQSSDSQQQGYADTGYADTGSAEASSTASPAGQYYAEASTEAPSYDGSANGYYGQQQGYADTGSAEASTEAPAYDGSANGYYGQSGSSTDGAFSPTDASSQTGLAPSPGAAMTPNTSDMTSASLLSGGDAYSSSSSPPYGAYDSSIGDSSTYGSGMSSGNSALSGSSGYSDYGYDGVDLVTTTTHKEVTLYCFALMMPSGYETGLLKMLHGRGASIFACDAFTLFSEGHIQVAPGVVTENIGSTKCDYGGPYHLAMNSGIFVRVWKKVIRDEMFIMHGWTVKVDPDAVFLPDRLRDQVRLSNPDANVYLNNCDQGLHGPIEVIARGGMITFGDGLQSCVDGLQHEFNEAGEDVFLRHCLGMLKIDRVDNFNLLSEQNCMWENPPKDGCISGKVSFHPFKQEDAYAKCLEQAAAKPPKANATKEAHAHKTKKVVRFEK